MHAEHLDDRIFEYIQVIGLMALRPLGAGNDGNVWETTNKTAVKAFHRPRNYDTELRCYQRLMEAEVKEIDGLTVPQLIGHDDERWIIEITIVQPPYLLDFGKAYIDEPSPYTAEQLAEWQANWIQYFPEADLPRVHKVLRLLKGIGIEYVDPKPWNICFRAEDAA